MGTEINRKRGENNWGSRMLFLLFTTALVISVGLAFFKFFILRDYPIQSQVECDPYTEACFTYHCDPAAEECSGDPVADTSYYKLLDRNAKNIPLCNPVEESCIPLVCPEGEEGCVVTFCDTSVDETAECTNPEEYSAEHSVVVESLEEEVLTDEQISPVETDPSVVPAE
jgi:hypothetical protein